MLVIKRILYFCAVIMILFMSDISLAAIYPERTYQTVWCNNNNGIMEVVLSDKTRVDCVLIDYVVEVDYAYKWAEAIGQSMHYSQMTGKQPGILLILESIDDTKHLVKLKESAYWIRVWIIHPWEIK